MDLQLLMDMDTCCNCVKNCMSCGNRNGIIVSKLNTM